MDPVVKKSVLRLFTYGLYAVGARQGDVVSGMTANWVVQSSFEPPMLALAVEADSHTCQVIRASGALAVSVYESGQRELAGRLGRTFAKHPEKLDGEIWKAGPLTGSPVLAEALGWVECRVQSSTPSGDHILFVAEVVEAGQNREGAPLTLKEAGFKYSG